MVVIQLVSNIISVVTEIILIILLWNYTLFFFQKKKEMLARQRSQFTCPQKVLIMWLYVMISANTVNLIVDNTLRFVKFMNVMDQSMVNFLVKSTVYLNLWYDIIFLNNCLGILFLCHSLAKMSAFARVMSLSEH